MRLGDYIERHQAKILAVVVIASAAILIWLDEHRTHPLPPGQAAPSFSMHLLGDEKDVTLASLHGEPVVLDFWATWCGPCRESLPHLNALSKRYTGQVRFFAVDAEGEDEALEREARDQLGLTIPIAIDGRAAANLYHVEMLPTTVLLDRNGRVADTFTGSTSPEAIARAIDKIL